ncbi:PREDICTED: uncharacterized protein LOC108372212 [Rhagoletis zephyria]|uniref:uncharacterized protein LOC108372212 n=1 Tax=Rhagoletis zephyria TaxID=28612 RepID=UPI0008114ECE|nr:PREDICTED: uncharacterized protein LOC108372212 [Rhagoletis zephyria]
MATTSAIVFPVTTIETSSANPTKVAPSGVDRRRFPSYMMFHSKGPSTDPCGTTAHRILDVFNRAIYLSDPKISLLYLENRLKFRKETINVPEEIQGIFMRATTNHDADGVENGSIEIYC